MQNNLPNQPQVKVAVYADQLPSPEENRQNLNDILAVVLLCLSALAAVWVS